MTIDVRIDFRPSLLAVRDQGARSTCLAHAVSVAHEYARLSALPLSPEYLHHFCTGGVASAGVSIAQASQALATNGQSLESDCPYQPSDPPTGWQPKPALNTYRRASKSASTRLADIEQSLRLGRAPVLGISLPAGFFSPSEPWIIESDGPSLGLHSIVAVGLGQRDANALVLIRNSWGTTWGNAGHAWLDERFVQLHLKEMLVLAEEIVS